MATATRLPELLQANYLIAKRHALRIILGKPSLGCLLAGKDLQVVDVAHFFRCINVYPDPHA